MTRRMYPEDDPYIPGPRPSPPRRRWNPTEDFLDDVFNAIPRPQEVDDAEAAMDLDTWDQMMSGEP